LLITYAAAYTLHDLDFFAMTPSMRKEEGKDYILPKIDGKTIDLDPDYAYS